MATATTATAPRTFADALQPTTAPAALARPASWLLLILVIGTAIRWWHINAPMQQDEFGPVYAVVDRAVKPGQSPSAGDPLVPLPSWQDVRARSVLPYGIVNPVPLYHYLLYGVVQVLPITEWSLRLPSLLAGLGCVLCIYFLCRRLLGMEVALAAALLAALDPIQVGASVLARPYALGNLACVLSFVALWQLVQTKRTLTAVMAALGYGLSLALLGYLNSVLLFVGIAQVAWLAYALFSRRSHALLKLSLWLAACALAALLLLPVLGYLREVQAFTLAHREYLGYVAQPPLASLLLHNLTFLLSLLVVSVAAVVIREIRSDAPGKPEAVNSSNMGNEPEPAENPELVWLGRFWLFLPQLAVLCLAYGTQQSVFLTRYLSYTSLGGVILLAYWATREKRRDVRLGVGATLGIALILWGMYPLSRGYGLTTDGNSGTMVSHLNQLEEQGRWKPGDVLLLRGTFLEADFLPDNGNTLNREVLRGAILAPLTTLYVTKTPKPIVCLSLSHYRSGQTKTHMGHLVDPEKTYNEELAGRLRPYDRFWIGTLQEWDRQEFLSCFLPWLADALGWDLKVARARPEPERYVDVYTDIKPKDYVAGLSDSQRTDFSHLILARRKTPRGIFMLGALSAAPLPYGYLTLPVSIAGFENTPRVTKPKDEMDDESVTFRAR